MTDGGAATEQMVLMTPGAVVVDAVARGIPAEPSSLITLQIHGWFMPAKEI